MRVGILSDSHGDAEATARAVALLEARRAEKLFHCGDICSEAVLDELAGHNCTFVWGNCDAPTPTLRRYVAEIGLTWPQPPVVVELAGKRIGLFHGHERAFRSAPAAAGLDYIFYGHTHVYDDRTENGCRWINPGALYRAQVRTVALLDLASGELQFLRVDDGEAV